MQKVAEGFAPVQVTAVSPTQVHPAVAAAQAAAAEVAANPVVEPNVGLTEALLEHGSFPPTPRTSGDTIHSLGMVWTIADDELRIRAMFEQRVRTGARAAIADAEHAGDIEEATRLRSQYVADYGAGLYNWGGQYINDALRTIPGMKHFLYLLLLRCHPNITEKVVNAMWRENSSACIMGLAWALGNLPSLSRKELDGGEVTQKELEMAIKR